jgi:phage shock protein A
MGILERAQQVTMSSFNALLSKFEEPGRDLAQLLSDMKEQILTAQRDLIKVVAESKRLQAKAETYSSEITRWERRAELAVRRGDDALAREALAQKRRLLEAEQRNALLNAEQRKVATAMKNEIARMNQKLCEYSQRQNTTIAQVSVSGSGGVAERLGQVGTALPFDEMRNMEAAIDRSEAETAANNELDELLSQTSLGTMSRDELDARFQALESNQEFASRLTEPTVTEPTVANDEIGAGQSAKAVAFETSRAKTPDSGLPTRVRIKT